MTNSFSIAKCLSLSVQLGDISDTPRLDAEVLLCEAMSVSKTYLYTWPEKTLDLNQFQRFDLFLKRRKTGEPVAYIIGRKEFWSRDFFVNESTLIPRPDTESLIEYLLDFYGDTKSELDVLDLGTGTGVLALTIALELPGACVDAVDCNEEAVLLATKNAEHLCVENTQVYVSNWFSQIPEKSYHFIVSNPPYIDKTDEHLDRGDVRFEPSSALVAEKKGLADIQSIINESKKYLYPGGQLVLEHGFDQAKQVRDMLRKGGYLNVVSHQDLSAQDRFTVGFV